MMSTIASTTVAFVAGALAWWGPKFITLGLTTQPGHQETTMDEYVLYYNSAIKMLAI